MHIWRFTLWHARIVSRSLSSRDWIRRCKDFTAVIHPHCTLRSVLLNRWIFACFRVVENNFFKQDWRSRKKKQIFQYIVMKWTLVLLIGLLTGVVGFFNNLAVENIAGLKLLFTGELMLKERWSFTLWHLLLSFIASAPANGPKLPEMEIYETFSCPNSWIVTEFMKVIIKFLFLQAARCDSV